MGHAKAWQRHGHVFSHQLCLGSGRQYRHMAFIIVHSLTVVLRGLEAFEVARRGDLVKEQLEGGPEKKLSITQRKKNGQTSGCEEGCAEWLAAL